MGTSLCRNGSRAHLIRVEHGPAQEASDDVALFLVGRLDVLVDGEGKSAHVVGDPPGSDAVGAGGLVSSPRTPRPRGDDRAEDVDVEVRGHALHGRGHAFQGPSGVDVLLRQRFEPTGTNSIELGEDEVPDLDFLDPFAVIKDSEQGPQTPLGPCVGAPAGQKLSSSPMGAMGRDSGIFVRLERVEGEFPSRYRDERDALDDHGPSSRGLECRFVECATQDRLEAPHVPRFPRMRTQSRMNESSLRPPYAQTHRHLTAQLGSQDSSMPTARKTTETTKKARPRLTSRGIQSRERARPAASARSVRPYASTLDCRDREALGEKRQASDMVAPVKALQRFVFLVRRFVLLAVCFLDEALKTAGGRGLRGDGLISLICAGWLPHDLISSWASSVYLRESRRKAACPIEAARVAASVRWPAR